MHNFLNKKIYIIRKTVQNTLFFISIFLILMFLLGFKLYGRPAGIMGYKFLFIASESMEPTLKTNSLCLVKTLSEDDSLKVGDIASYTLPGQTISITHRIIGIENGMFLFKGDNNDFADASLVPRECIDYIALAH